MITIEPEVITIGLAVGVFVGTLSSILGHLITAVFRWISHH